MFETLALWSPVTAQPCAVVQKQPGSMQTNVHACILMKLFMDTEI